MKAIMRLPVLAFLLAAVGGQGLVLAQTVDTVHLRAPAGGETTGSRPVFRIGVEGSDLTKMKFKILLSRDGFDTVAAAFDQLAEGAGWAYDVYGDEPGATYRVKEPLPGGVYDWKAMVWNGFEWIPTKSVSRFLVDTVPPAEVEGITMSVDREKRKVVLRWASVVTDAEGHAERVAQYRVYRYVKKSPFFSIRYFQIGETDQTFFEDKDPTVVDTPLLFYKIAAVDVSGNEPGRRY